MSKKKKVTRPKRKKPQLMSKKFMQPLSAIVVLKRGNDGDGVS